jgi:hypothetical protein
VRVSTGGVFTPLVCNGHHVLGSNRTAMIAILAIPQLVACTSDEVIDP